MPWKSRLARATIASNAIGLHVQEGSVISLEASVPATVGPREVVINDTTFEGNAVRLGAGTMLLPAPLQAK